MTSPVPQVRVRGLYTGRGLVDAPAGAMQVADNVVCLLPGTIEPRRGDELLAGAVRNSSVPHASAVAYAEHMLVHVSAVPGQLQVVDANSNADALYPATMHPRGGIPMRALGRQAYLCTGDGVQIAGAAVAAPRGAGVPRVLDLSDLSLGGTSAINANSVVAYRAVWGYRWTDPSTGEVREQWGAPSARHIVRNAGGTAINRNISMSWPGSGAVNGAVNLVRLYRTENATPSTADPGDEMFLVREDAMTAGVSPASIILSDTTPDAFLAAPLYTNADTGDGLGAAGANLPPPTACSDVAAWESRVWYAIYGTRGSWRAQVIGTAGFVAGTSTVWLSSFDAAGAVVDTYVLTAVSGTPTSGQFQVSTGGTPSQNVEATARSLVAAINNISAGSFAFASYASGANDPPGLIEVWPHDQLAGVASVGIYSPTGTGPARMFSPALPVDDDDASAAQIRYLDVRPGVLVWSKPGQPESVPPLNSLLIGDPYQPIIALAGLREGLVVAKVDGLYLVHGSAGQYGVQTLDASVRMPTDARCGGRGTAQVLNNELYLHASDGRVYVASESGVRAIDGDVMDALRWAKSTWGATDERDGLYVLSVGAGSITDRRAYVYSSETRAWTRWGPLIPLPYRHWMTAWPRGGFVSFQNAVVVTRSSGAVADYQDWYAEESLTFSAPVDGVQTITGFSLVPQVGWELTSVANPSQRVVVIEAFPGYRCLVVGDPITPGVSVSLRWTTPIDARIQSVPWHGGQAGARKSFAGALLHFDRYGLSPVGLAPISAITPWAQFQREASGGGGRHTNVVIPDQSITPEEANGDWNERVQPRSVHVTVPREQQALGMLSVGLSTKQLRRFWRLGGWTLEAAQGGTAVSR